MKGFGTIYLSYGLQIFGNAGLSEGHFFVILQYIESDDDT